MNLETQRNVTSTEGEEWSDFTRLDNFLELNGVTKEDTFLIEKHVAIPSE